MPRPRLNKCFCSYLHDSHPQALLVAQENRRLLVPALIWGAFALLFLVIGTIIAIIVTPVKIAAIVSVVHVPLLGERTVSSAAPRSAQTQSHCTVIVT